MATVIDSLVVELGLDPSKFNANRRKSLDAFKKTGEEAARTAKDIEASGKRAAEFFTGIKNAAIGLFTVMAGTDMARFARDTMTSVAATGRLARNIGVSTDELSAFARMIERNGGNADAAAESMRNLTNQVENFKVFGQASQQFQIFLATIGATANDSALQDYMKFVAFSDRHRNDPKLVNLIGLSGGLDQGSINEALKGVRQVQADLAKSRVITVPSDADAKALQTMQESWTGLDQAINSVGRDLLLKAAPAFDRIADGATHWIEANRKIADTIGGIATAIVGLASLKPAAWVLRLLGLGALVDAAPAGALAAAAGGATYLANKEIQRSSEGAIVAVDPMTGMPIYAHNVPPGGVYAAIPPRSLRDRAMAYFQSQGWTAAQAAAIVANADAESGMNPNASNAGHKGLFQWSKARRDAILAGTGIDVWKASAADQLRAAQWELTHTEKAAGRGLRGINDARAGAVFLDRFFERSGDTSMLEQHRALLAGGLAAASGGGTHVETDVSIGTMVVNTRATDADGIAKDIGGALRKNVGSPMSVAAQANSGLN